jgi:hypothetical protein
MDLLELNEIGNKLVGTIGDAGLSIEEAKRLTIGVELVGIYNFAYFTLIKMAREGLNDVHLLFVNII